METPRAQRTSCGDGETSSSEGSKRSIILGELEDELERQLEEKAKRNELSANNVKSLLKAVLTQEDVFKYVESTMAKSNELPEYQLKLTRAKAKELIDRIPKIAPLLCLPMIQKKSDMDVLIREELPEDSSDEEYQPLDETVDDDEESMLAGSDANIISPAKCPPTPETSVVGPDENIGQRTRSKLSLSETPLETIEQAFIPPDITEDMYNTECDNQDWLNFLKDLVQPLDTSAVHEAHDDENDPEYNVQPDELDPPDNEELRADPAVKISKKEINDLMSELFEYTKMHLDCLPSDEEQPVNTKINTVVENLTSCEPQYELPASDNISCETEFKPTCETEFKPTEASGPALEPSLEPYNHIIPVPEAKRRIPSVFSEEQHLLIDQQLSQHVQLLLQTCLLSCGSPFVSDELRESAKSCLKELKIRLNSVNPVESTFSLPTLHQSLALLSKYETLVDSNLQSFLKWNREKASHKTYVKTRWAGSTPVHPILMRLCLRSSVFQYPLLLPQNGFRDGSKAKVCPRFSPAQEILIASGLDDCTANLNFTFPFDKATLLECCDLIHKALLPDRLPKDIFENVKRKGTRGPDTNPIRRYFLYGCPPAVEHYVVPLDSIKPFPLYLQDTNLIHISWHKALYEERDYHNSQSYTSVSRKKPKLDEPAESPMVKAEILVKEENAS